VSINSSKKLIVFVSFLATVILSFAVLEIRFYYNAPTTEEIETLAAQNVGTASKAFEKFISDFEEENQVIANKIKPLLTDTSSPQSIYDVLNTNENLWGASLKKDGRILIWTGFKLLPSNELAFSNSKSLLISIEQTQNVTSINASQQLFGIDNEKYVLTTSKKLKQVNVLDIGGDTEVTLPDILDLDFDFPIHFSLQEPLPDDIIFKTEQEFTDDSFVTAIYATKTDITNFETSRKTNHAKLRLVFIVLILLFGSLILFTLSSYHDPKKAFLISTISIFIIWLLTWLLLPHLGLELVFGNQSIEIELFYLGLNCFLSFSFAVFISDFYNSSLSTSHKLSAFLGSLICLIIGALISLVLTGIFTSLFGITAETILNLNDLRLVPDVSIFLYYFLAGTFWITACWSIIYFFIFLLKSSSADVPISILFIVTGFLVSVVSLNLFYFETGFNWLFYSPLILFLLLSGIAYFYTIGFLNLGDKSRLRLFLMVCLFASVLSYIPFYYGQIEWRSETMMEEAESFDQQNELEIETITIETLFLLEEQLSQLQVTSVQEESSILTSEFNKQVELLFNQHPDWQSFSFSIQLINSSGDAISEFTSNLNAPGWTKTYDIFSLEVPFEQERIRRDRLRPIIRRNPLEQPPAKYTSFRQGWIPFFASPSSDEKLGWIICSVYQEQPQYKKPLRAVVASKRESDKFSTFLLSAYENQQLSRNSISGTPLEIPNYNMLPEEISERLSRDSLFITTEIIDEKSVIELFWKRAEGTIIKVSTLDVTLFNHVFSILRFFFYLLIFIFLLSLLMQWKRNLRILGTNNKFKDRLTDRFIISSLLCLTALITTSSIAITEQSEQATIEELENKLSGINTTFENNNSGDLNQTLLVSSTLINSDAVLFEGNELVGSTAPQIFTQHLLPAQIPWNIFNAIVNERSDLEIEEFELGGLEFLIGYTPIMRDGQVTNIVAIPTFLKTPSFNEQLLTTISYLVGLFVLIFGLFIVAAAMIANRMTSPLEELSAGIKTISEGSLETTLPVKSSDEIGSLTNTFNIMVYRLQELRKNLVEAEREAAWKEMAQQVAHEIKNPLTPMKLNLQHLDRQIKASDISEEDLKKKVAKINSNMIEQIESLSRIASDFSKFARPMEQEFVELDVNPILQHVIELYSNEKFVSINANLSQTPILIRGVKDELQRVFINLVKNGIEAIPKQREGIITVKSWRTNFKVNIEISDNGEGISTDNLTSIFVPNFSTKSSGTGLGLAIAKKVVEEHGGEISFTSTINKGTTFSISFDLFTGKDTY